MDEETKKAVEDLIKETLNPISESIETLKATLAEKEKPAEENKDPDPEKPKETKDPFLAWAVEEEK